MSSIRRQTLIAGNWKLHLTIGESIELASSIRSGLGQPPPCEVVVAPVFTALQAVSGVLKGSAYQVAAQDLYWEASGAHTGEVSGPLLADAGCTFAIVGHSERRQRFGDTDAVVRKKVRAAIDNNLVPIACFGETLEEREGNSTLEVVGRQVRSIVEGMSTNIDCSRVVLAYEPVWAIGTGKTASPDQAQEVHSSVRELLGRLRGNEFAAGCRILYGGSVKPDNASSLLTQADIDGVLVGGASLRADSFLGIIRAVEPIGEC